jgi:hypothetical protein
MRPLFPFSSSRSAHAILLALYLPSALIVSHRRPYSPTPIPIRHDTLGRTCLQRTLRPAHALPRPRLFPSRPHPRATHPLAVAAVPGLRQPRPSRPRAGRKRRRRRGVGSSERWSGPGGASAWSPGVCGRAVRRSGNGPKRLCRTASVGADEGKADRPPSRAVSALRPWIASMEWS